MDWDFYGDGWLIDKLPDNQIISIERHPNGVVINPPSLECYFGSNPEYLYGQGMFLHEVLMSPNGIAIYPEFLERPGFEFVESISIESDQSNRGLVNGQEYIGLTMKKLYGLSEYANIKTPSSGLRMLSSSDRDAVQKSFDIYQSFKDVNEMKLNGCFFYIHGYAERDGIRELTSNTYLQIDSDKAPINIPSVFGKTVFLKNISIDIGDVAEIGLSDFQIMFTTLENFRFGDIINISDSFIVTIREDRIVITIAGEKLEIFHSADYGVSHQFLIAKTSTKVWVVLDGAYVSSVSHSNLPISTSGNNIISGTAGDIEEVAFFDRVLDGDILDVYYSGVAPFIRSEINSSVDSVPAELSYGLTYTKPTEIYIPDSDDILKIYLEDDVGNISEVSGGDMVLMDNGMKFQSVKTDNKENKISAITKLSTESPIKISIKFKIPDFHNESNIYNMQLSLKSIGKFLTYKYKELKDENVV